jgi:hypothetical protein
MKNHFYWLIDSLMSELKIPITHRYLKSISELRSFFSLEEVAQVVARLNINSLGVKLNPAQIVEVQFPAIVQMFTSEAGFCIVKTVRDDFVEYVTFENGLIRKSVDDFEKEWSGIALLLEKTEKSGEPNYAVNHRLEILEKIRSGVAYSLIVLLLIGFWWVWPTFILPILLLSAGLGISIALLKQTLGQETILSQAICRPGTSTDCNKVINSKLAKVYGDISLAEIALVFFASLLCAQIISLAIDQGHNFLLGWLSFAAVPVSVLSIYYQWRVLKTWCLLCLGVVACLWGLAGFYGYHTQNWSYGWPAIQAFGIGVVVPLLFWFLVRTPIMQAARVPGLEKGLNKFRKSLSVFEALTAQKPEIQPEFYSGDVVLGNIEVSNLITIVTSPTCGPCVRAHQFIEECLEEHGANLKAIFRFAVNPADTGVSGAVAKHLISLGLNGGNQLDAAMHAWYGAEKPKLKEWLERFPTEAHNEAQARLTQHSNWCRGNQINATPTIFFNGRQLPEEFSLHDFEYFLRLKMAEVEMELV